VACLALAVASAVHANSTIIILDASASMSTGLGDGTRLDAAKKAVNLVLNTMHEEAPEHEVGLVSFYDGCWVDVMARQAPLAEAHPKLLSKVSGLATREYGHTPIAQSLFIAADLLEGTAGNVILVSDGQESCDETIDLCALATRLKENNILFEVNLIGLALSRRQKDALMCIAENTGGVFIVANDPESLKDALGLAAQESLETGGPSCIDNRGGLLHWWCEEDETEGTSP